MILRTPTPHEEKKFSVFYKDFYFLLFLLLFSFVRDAGGFSSEDNASMIFSEFTELEMRKPFFFF